jgi:hypothetical protein
MSLVTVKFYPELRVSHGITRPAHYFVEVYREGSRRLPWTYILVGAELHSNKFTPIEGERTFEFYHDSAWRLPEKRVSKVFQLRQMGLEGKFLREKSGTKEFEVTQITFGSSKVTPDDLLDLEGNRQKTPYM